MPITNVTIGYIVKRFKIIRPELQTMVENSRMDLEQLFQDAEQIQHFRNCLFDELYHKFGSRQRLLEQTTTNATIPVLIKNLLNNEEFKNVKSLQNFEITEAWFKKFKEIICKAERPYHLTADQRYELYKFIRQNREMTFRQVAENLSEIFEAWVVIYLKIIFKYFKLKLK